jgi:hypothetical protein
LPAALTYLQQNAKLLSVIGKEKGNRRYDLKDCECIDVKISKLFTAARNGDGI